MSKDLVVGIEKYTNAQGEEKTKYVKIGVILTNTNGEYALLDPTINLAGIMMKQRMMNPDKASGSVIAGIFDNTDRNQSQNQAGQEQQAPPVATDDPSDIPF